jgi:phosphatidylglycerol lysyltransferase
MLGALLPSRREFYRKSSLLNQPLTAGWITSIALILICTVWLVFFSYKHIEYSNELWWRFSFSEGHAPRSLRAMVGVFTLALLFALARLLRFAPMEAVPPGRAELPRLRELVANSRETYAHLALLSDKSLLFSDDRRGFIMYGVEGNSYVAMGDPVAPPEQARELAWRFRELCEYHGGWSVFYQIGRQNLDLYIDLGVNLLKIGEEARVPLAAFSLEGKSRKNLRNLKNKLENEQIRFQIAPPEAISALLPELKGISDAWLTGKNTREKRFSLGFFDDEYLQLCPVALVRQGEEIMAFANLWLGKDRWEASVDLMRHRPDAPHGIMDYLLTELMLWSKQGGYLWFNLGMAPLSGLRNRSLAPLWNRLGALIFGYGGHFYNFRGVRQYKEKFDPHWEPRYLAIPAGASLPRILINLASLIAGGATGTVKK